MSVFLRRSAGAILAYSVASGAAWAELTADDVWADWQAYLNGVGYDVSGTQNRSGGTLTVSDIAMSMELPEQDGEFSMTLPQMTFSENGDGTVSVGIPESFPIAITGTAEGEEGFVANATYRQDGMDMVVSGTPDDMTYVYSANQLGAALDSIMVGDETLPDDLVRMSMDAVDVAGTSRMVIGETREIDQSFTAVTLKYDVSFADPESQESGKIKGNLNELAFDGGGAVPTDVVATDYQAMIDAGFNFNGAFSFGSGNTEAAGTGPEGDFEMTSASEGGRFALDMNADHLGYDLSQNGVKLNISAPEMPFPVELTMAGAGLKFEMPVQPSEAEQPFAFAMNLSEFTMSDVLWSIFDPAGALPRDPATVSLDTSGTAVVTQSFLDPDVAAALEATDTPPGELRSFNVNELLVSLVGATLSGSGAFTFDNADLETFDGMPAPTGALNLQLEGANALIDTLIGMGIITESDAMGARMMMGMFAVAGDAPDTLESTLEVTEEGHVLANGQRIK